MTRRSCLAVALACNLVLPAFFAQTSTLPPVSGPPVVVSQPTGVPVLQAPASPRIPEPLPQPTVADGTRYLNNPELLKFCNKQFTQLDGRDADMIFIGDSITQGWVGRGQALWDANFAPHHALNFGISGDQTQNVLWRLENYPLQRLHPKVAVILIGTNNIHNTAPEIADGVKAVMTKTQTLFPGIRIILVSIMPNLRANALMMAANNILRTFADDQTVYYLDLVPLMPPEGDNWKGLGPDHLHLLEPGYQIWTNALVPVLNKLLPPAAHH